MPQPDVAFSGLAQVRFAVEADVAEHARELVLVGVLDGQQGLVDDLADVVGVALPVQVGKERPDRHHETVKFQFAPDAFLVIAVLGFQGSW